VSESEVEKIINEVNPNAAGPDGIKISFLKLFTYVVPNLTNILIYLNLEYSIQFGRTQ